MALMRRKNKVRELRKLKKLSGYDLAVLTKLHASRIYSIERGLAKWPADYEKEWISAALGFPVEEVFPRDLRLSREIVDCRTLKRLTISGAI